ncbi:GNAT family N-acetyltransferase [Blastococcus sp. SYSU DS0552]
MITVWVAWICDTSRLPGSTSTPSPPATWTSTSRSCRTPGSGGTCRRAGTPTPGGRRGGISHSLGHWARDGLGYWTARLREDLPGSGLLAGHVVGTGGCAVRVGTAWWNLYYRFAAPAWGRGLAAEMVDAALDAARAVRPELPVVAYLLEHNVQSRARAERAGLELVWRGPDAGNPDPAAVRLVYADRALDDVLLARVTAHD